jgi:hypothetical protein
MLVTNNDVGEILEISRDRVEAWKLNCQNHPRSVEVLNDGRLLVADFRQVAIYEPDSPIPVWAHEFNGVQSACALASGNFLLGNANGLTVISPDKKTLWTWEQPVIDGCGFYAKVF